MDGAAVKELRAGLAQPQVFPPLDGGLLTIPTGHSVYVPPVYLPATLGVFTLDAVKHYVESKLDGQEPEDVVVHVVDPQRVDVLGPLREREEQFERPIYLTAKTPGSGFTFGRYMPADEFMVSLMTQFAKSPDRETLIEMMGGVVQSDVRQYVDNGVSQEMTIKRGVTGVKWEKLPNPVTLIPFRTFRELDQPESLFVVRAREGDANDGKPDLALFEADGGAWKLSCIDRAGAWLRTALPITKVFA